MSVKPRTLWFSPYWFMEKLLLIADECRGSKMIIGSVSKSMKEQVHCGLLFFSDLGVVHFRCSQYQRWL